jgi:hypothetical protein
MMDKGLPPIGGGMLDQERRFLDAYWFVSCEKARHEAGQLKGT